MRAELGLPSVKGDDEHGGGMTGGFGGSMGGAQGGKGKRPISVKFEIPYFTTSGIQVRYLKIIEPKVCKSFFSCTLDFPVSSPSSLALGVSSRSWCNDGTSCGFQVAYWPPAAGGREAPMDLSLHVAQAHACKCFGKSVRAGPLDRLWICQSVTQSCDPRLQI